MLHLRLALHEKIHAPETAPSAMSAAMPVPCEAPAEGPKLAHTNADLCAKWQLVERAVEIKGRGVFPGVAIPAGELVVKFEGPVYDKDTCPDFSEAIQVRPRPLPRRARPPPRYPSRSRP